MNATDFENLVDEMHEMARVIAPELPGIYILQHQEDDIRMPDDCTAYALKPRESIVLRRCLKERGAWKGCQASVVFANIDHLGSDDLRGILIHELSHLLPTRPVVPFEPSQEFEERSRELFTEAGRDTTPTVEPWLQDGNHADGFVRRSLHLHTRCVGAGWAMSYRDLNVAGPKYGLSDAWDYARALAGEPDRMRDATFAEIESTPPPEQFTALFETDTARCREWLARHVANQKEKT